MIKSLIQIFKIIRWHKRTFPNFTCQQQKEKLAGEIREWEDALGEFIRTRQEKHRIHTEEELTDVVIAATNLYRYKEMRQLIAQKMKINRTRFWNKGQHK